VGYRSSVFSDWLLLNSLLYEGFETREAEFEMKYIYLTFSDKSVWRLPLEVIAEDYADYHEHKREKNPDHDGTYEEDFDMIMTDDFEGIDWMQNNMNWDEIEPHLELVEKAPHEDPRASEFPNMDSEIKESDD
jgi:hypothetical protein